MKRVLSVVTLVIYSTQLIASCGPGPSRSADDRVSLFSTSSDKLEGNDQLAAPPDTVVTTDSDYLDDAGKAITAGSSQGSFAVTDDGAASYRLPLWVPPGRAGMQPALALQYNSRDGNGLLGMGFSLAGLSRISRCARTVAQDGATAPVRFDVSDAFCLDGNRLVLVSSDRAYGADGSEYRTEVDTFAKVVLRGGGPLGPDLFEVYRKDGRIFLYGSTQNSRLEGQRATMVQAPPTGASAQYTDARLTWSVSEVRDRQGNYMRFSYRPLTEAGEGFMYEQMLDSIEYTGSYTDPTVATPRRLIRFEYEPRPDKSYQYLSGFGLRSTNRLRSIEMRGPDVPGVSSTTPPPLWRKYLLKYFNGSISGRSLLHSFQECDGRNVCFNPTLLAWSLGSTTFETIDTGIPDVAANASLAMGFSSRDFWNLQVADINGDGKDDILYRYQEPSNSAGLQPAKWRLRFSTGTGFSAHMVVSLPDSASMLPVSTKGDALDDLLTVDMDMDGKTEVLALNRVDCENWIPGHQQLYRWNGSQFVGLITDDSEIYDTCFDNGLVFPARAMQVGDTTGDGLPDLLRSWRARNAPAAVATSWAYRPNQYGSTGSLSFAPYTDLGLQSGVDHLGFVLDIDGDGASELLLRKPNAADIARGPDGFAAYYTAVGINPDGTRREKETTLSALPWDAAYSSTFHYRSVWFADVTGDGLPDALSIIKELDPPYGAQRELNVAINTGNGFLPPTSVSLPPGSLPGPAKWAETGRLIDNGLRLTDFNFDGRQDLLLTEYYVDRGVPRTHLTLLQATATGSSFATHTLSSIPVGLATGDGYETPGNPPDLEGSGWGQKLTRLADVNGDGLQDIIQVVGSVSVAGTNSRVLIHLRNGLKPDLLVNVAEGAGNSVAITHKPLASTPGLHTPGVCSYPQYCGVRGMWAVAEFSTGTGLENPKPTFNRFTLTYEGGRTDLRGRGWLGFSRRELLDVQTGKKHTWEYANTVRTGPGLYLHAGTPAREVVSTPLSTGTHVRTVDSMREPRTSTQGRSYFLCPATTTTEETEGAAGVLNWVQTYQRCDDYGNPTYLDTVVRKNGSSSTGTRLWHETTYDNHPSTWVLGLPRYVKETLITAPSIRHAGGQVSSRTRSIQYCAVGPCPESNLPWRETVEPEQGPEVKLVTTYTRDEKTGQVTAIEQADVLGGVRTETLRYHAAEKLFPSVHINAAGHREDVAHHPSLGVVALTEDANAVRQRFAYDGFGRPRMQTAPYRESGSLSGGASVLLHYNLTLEQPAFQTRVTATRDGSPTVVMTLDRLGREVERRTQTPGGGWSSTTTGYDRFGRVSDVTAPHFERERRAVSSFSYDNLGRVLWETLPDGSARETVYEGLRTRRFDELRNETLVTRDELGHVVKVEEQKDATSPKVTTQYVYAPFGLLDSIVDTQGRVTQLQYDRLGRRTHLTEPELGTTTTQYNAFGDVVEETNAGGIKATYGYDALGRETSVTTPDGITRFIWDTALHGVGRLATATNERTPGTSADDIVTSYGYDGLGRVTQEVLNLDGALYTVDQSFDGHGRPDILTYPAAAGQQRFAVKNTYTPTGELLAVRNLASGLEYWRAQERNALGQVVSERRGSGILTQRRYDSLGQVRFIESRLGSGGAPLQQNAYAYHANGNLRSRHDVLAKVTEDFQYDGLDRLTHWTVQARCDRTTTTYGYDDLGNISSKQVVRNGATTERLFYQYGLGSAPPDAVTGVSTDPAFGTLSETLTYDASGNQTGWSDVLGRSRTVAYTAFNLPSTLQTQAGTLTFAYDAHQRRVRKQNSTGNFTVYVGGLYELRREEGSTSHVFQVMAQGLPVAQVTWAETGGGVSPNTAYLHHDNLGSIEVVTDAAGTLLERRKYQPFGLRGREDDPSIAHGPALGGIRLGFTSHEADEEAGLINMKGRIYDPRLGRFLTRDPVVQAPFFSQAHNHYSYVTNNPLRFIDPTGFAAYEPVPTVTLGEWPTEDGMGMAICAAPCSSGTVPGLGDADDGQAAMDGPEVPSAPTIAGTADQNGSIPSGGIASDCRFCVGDGRGLFAMSTQDMNEVQGWLRSTWLGYVPILGTGLSALNMSLSLMRGKWEVLGGDAAGLALSIGGAKVVGLPLKAAASRIVSSAKGIGSVALDNNAIIAAVINGRAADVLKGRSPVVSITAAKEFLRGPGRTADQLRAFLTAHGGRIGASGQEAAVDALQAKATALGRVLHRPDARVVASAMREGLPLATNDTRLYKFLQAIGVANEQF